MKLCAKTVGIALLVCLLGVAGQAWWKDSRYRGYTFSTDVQKVRLLTDDFCEIFGAMLVGNKQRALSVFYNGSNALPLTYAALANSTATANSRLYNALFSGASYTSPTSLLVAFNNAVASGNPFAVLQNTLYAIHGKIMFQYLDTAVLNINAYNVVQQNLDSAWALFTGMPGRNLALCTDNMYNVFELLSDVFGGYRNVAPSNLYLAQQFGDAQAKSKNPSDISAAREAVSTASLNIASVYTEFGLQWILYNAKSVDIGTACGNSNITNAARYQATMVIDFIKALTSGLGASASSVSALSDAVNAGVGYNAMQAAVQAVVMGTGIPFSAIVPSSPNVAAIKHKWASTYGPDYNVESCTSA